MIDFEYVVIMIIFFSELYKDEIKVVMRRSNRNFNIPPPPGKPRAFELLKIGLFKFPPPRTKMAFKCPTVSSDLSVKWAPPKEQSSSAPVVAI